MGDAGLENREMHPGEGKESFSYLGGLSLVSNVRCPIGRDAIFFLAHCSGLHHGLLRAVDRGLKLTFGLGWKGFSNRIDQMSESALNLSREVK